MRTVALDACALLAYLHREPGGEKVRAWLREAASGERRVLLHRLSLGEVYYLARATGGERGATRLLADLRRLPCDTAGPLGFELLRAAARLKTDHRVPYVDAVAGAWAQANDALLATTDHRAFDDAARNGALDVVFLR